MGLDLHKLGHLVAVAEEGSFTRAAARLHLSQQALSTSIRALEREVGVDLLERTTTGVAVLPAGEALIADARVLEGVARSALQRARRIGRGESEVLRIGHTPAVTGDEVTALLRRVHTDHPELATDVNQRYPAELTEQLLAGELDLGLCRAMSPAHGLNRTTLVRQRLQIAVSAEHRFAGRDVVELAELADERIVVWGHPGRSGYTDLLLEHCRQAGFEPRTHRNPIQGTPPVTAVLGTDDIAFVTAEPGPAANGKVRVVALRPLIEVPLHALWPAHTTSDARHAFLAAFG
ncbi:DNA-binding transcriptional regulator, LysR family [Saccharopolyspora antimicrobica]|uniref:DNA-binding transcriptional LysR family regulator n=1 Tax=Saccharopolyspora antimicrobica TaxID=455193 RepID=A0A1I5HC87_9PSEU|nr:LysR substrate-binding domain-containing protein [Saccharopolyspora antimicrobica]RKT85379.1 DNA-binding transcriptional LysR family regulator [Saccharopolyspora antimicrobica]SFO45807.1 DNA-binding transcriptional regulator, LysR family [Saccharopolyspora antimicrobica]